jgi:hypothetical protein
MEGAREMVIGISDIVSYERTPNAQVQGKREQRRNKQNREKGKKCPFSPMFV